MMSFSNPLVPTIVLFAILIVLLTSSAGEKIWRWVWTHVLHYWQARVLVPKEQAPKMAAVHLLATSLLLVGSLVTLRILIILPLIWVVPIAVGKIVRTQQKKTVAAGLDTTIGALANALLVTGNLVEAIDDVAKGEQPLMKKYLNNMLASVRLGVPLEEALEQLKMEVGLPAFDAAISSLIIGKRTGGDLHHILKTCAASISEMNRLEGMVQSQTAEGRGQALVMGLVPPGLCLILHFVNPNWLAPMWHDPIGWALIGLCVTLEVAAILAIRKITAVDL